MQFTPKSDAEFQQEAEERASKYLWPKDSIVDYEIKQAVEKTSKKGKTMIEIDVDVYNDKGDVLSLKDWLGEWNLFKLKHICEANGMEDAYANGLVHDFDLVGKTGKAKLGISKGAQKDDGSFYSDRNSIADFVKPLDAVKKDNDARAAKVDPELDDEIPFALILPAIGISSLALNHISELFGYAQGFIG